MSVRTIVVLFLAVLTGSPQASAQVLSAGTYNTCALTRAGGVECWGTEITSPGGTGERRLIPFAVDTLASGVAAVSVGEGFGCALKTTGRMVCWGQGPGRIGGTFGTSVKALSAGINHSCVVTTAGGAMCWGVGLDGRLGHGSMDGAGAPVNVLGLDRGVRSISAGDWDTCATKEDGSVWCWGRAYGSRSSPELVPMFDVVHEVQVAGEYTCGLSDEHAVSCWGGRFGAPTPVSLPGPVVGLSAGVQQTCAVTLSGEVHCWGNGTAPGRVADLPAAASVTVARYHTCALLRTGSSMCWGDNTHSQLGLGISAKHLGVPTRIAQGASGVLDLSLGGQWGGTGGVGSEVYLCFISGASTWCSGNNDRGQLANGMRTDNTFLTLALPLPSDVVQVQTGLYHTCARTASRDVYCWGAANRVGIVTTQDALRTVRVASLDGQALSLTAGWTHTCVVDGGHGVQCWGSNESGELGDGTTASHSTPVRVGGISDVRQVEAGWEYTCALTNAGGVKCWGRNQSGQVGDNTGVDRLVPTDVPGLTSGVATIDAGVFHACVVTEAGEVHCWGRNNAGQIGDGTRANRAAPRRVSALTGRAVDVAAGEGHTCALMSDNRIFCWGRNDSGQLGDVTRTDQVTPVEVRNVPYGVVGLRAGPMTTCAITQTGAAYCWGQNPVLSSPPPLSRSTPEQVFDAVDGRAQATAASLFAPTTIATQAFTLPGAVPVASLTWSAGSGTLPDSVRMVVLPRQSPASEGVWRTWEARVDGGAPGWMARLRLYYDSNEVQSGTDEAALRLFQSTDRFATARELPVVARDVAANWVEADIGAGDVSAGGWTSFRVAPALGTAAAPPGVVSNDALVQVWPNPARASARIDVRLPAPQRVEVGVYDLMGRRLQVLHDGVAPVDLSVKLDTAPLPNGAYLVVVSGAGVRVSRLFTVFR